MHTMPTNTYYARMRRRLRTLDDKEIDRLLDLLLILNPHRLLRIVSEKDEAGWKAEERQHPNLEKLVLQRKWREAYILSDLLPHHRPLMAALVHAMKADRKYIKVLSTTYAKRYAEFLGGASPQEQLAGGSRE